MTVNQNINGDDAKNGNGQGEQKERELKAAKLAREIESANRAALELSPEETRVFHYPTPVVGTAKNMGPDYRVFTPIDTAGYSSESTLPNFVHPEAVDDMYNRSVYLTVYLKRMQDAVHDVAVRVGELEVSMFSGMPAFKIAVERRIFEGFETLPYEKQQGVLFYVQYLILTNRYFFYETGLSATATHKHFNGPLTGWFPNQDSVFNLYNH